MNSVKTNSNHYHLFEGKAVAGFLIRPLDGNGKAIYVAWEWPNMADDNFFAVCRVVVTDDLADIFSGTYMLKHVIDYGSDITGTPEAEQAFPHLFKK